MKRIDAAIAIGLVFSIFLGSLSVFGHQCDDVRDTALRLHILANSDEEDDQNLKLAVRDAVLAGTADLFAAPRTKDEAQQLAAAHLREIEAIARAEIARQGYGYDVSAQVVNRFFDTRVYDDFTMPAGRYDAVQIEIGSGEGHNWWCVMFPPMCIPAASDSGDTPAEQQIRELGGQPQYKPAFAIVEAIESIQEWFAK